MKRLLLLLLLAGSCLHAATPAPINVQMTGDGTNKLLRNINVGPGVTVTFLSGGTLTADAGSIINGIGGGLPSQTGHAGQFLTTNGTVASWLAIPGGGDMLLAGIQTVTGAKTFNDAKLILAGATSGTTILKANATAGSGTVFLPLTGTLSTLAGSEAFTNKTYNGVTLTGGSTPTLAVTGTTTVSGANTGDQTSVTGNAGTATALQTARNINGVAFDGTGNITVTAAAGTLTGATLASNVLASSLTSAAGGTFGTNAFTSTAYVPTSRTINGHDLSANFVISASDITTGTLPAAQLPLGSSSAFGAVKVDGTTITASAGVISAVTGGGGNVSNVGTPTNGQIAQWTTATSIQGINSVPAAQGGFGADISASSGVPLFASGTPTFTSTSGAGNFVRVSSATLTAPLIAKLANLTTNGFVTTTGGDGTLTIDTSTYLTAAGAVTSAIGTANQVLVNGGTSAQVGAVTFTLPQSIGTSSSPQFATLGLGAAASSNAGFRNSAAVTASSGTVYGYFGFSTLTAAANANSIYEMWLGNGTIAKSTFTGLTGYSLRIANPSVTGAGTIDNYYGVYIEAMTRGTTNYAFRSAGAGLVLIGDTTEATTGGAGSVVTAGGLYATKKIIGGSDATFAGILTVGSGPTIHTDAAGKILAAALNTVTVAVGGTGGTTLTAHGVLMGNGTSAIAQSSAGTSGYFFKSGGASADGAYASLRRGIGACAGGGTITTGKLYGYYTATYSGTITAYNITVDAGTATFKVWKIAAGTAKPTSSNSINTSGVAISTGTNIRSTTLSDFTSTTVTSGDIFAFEITAVSGVTDIAVSIEVTEN